MVKNLLLVLLVVLTTIFSACSTTHTAPPPQVILIVPPDNFLQEQPVVRVVNVSKQGIAEGYIPNTIRLGVSNQNIRDLKRWKEAQIKLHGVPYDNTSK